MRVQGIRVCLFCLGLIQAETVWDKAFGIIRLAPAVSGKPQTKKLMPSKPMPPHQVAGRIIHRRIVNARMVRHPLATDLQTFPSLCCPNQGLSLCLENHNANP